MTWSATLKIEDVSEGPAPIDVLATSEEVTSNTEGKIRSVEVRFQLDADETNVKIGDTISVSGHFQG